MAEKEPKTQEQLEAETLALEMKAAPLLGREELLVPEDRIIRDVYIPEWKGKVKIRNMSAREGLAFTKAVQEPGTEGMFLAFVHSICDEEGKLLFNSPDDTVIEQLKARSLSGFVIVQQEVLELNRLGDYALEALQAAKNALSKMV